MIQYAKNGVDSLTTDAVNSVRNFLLSQWHEDGGFLGRDKKSDLYYTVFGIQLMQALELTPEKKLSNFLKSFGNGEELDFVHLASLIRCSALTQIENQSILQIESFRSSDGGYSHLNINAEHGTIYAGFLAYLAYLESALPIPDSCKLIKSLERLKMRDGSYANDSEMNTGSTTATAAAIVLLNACGEKVEKATTNALASRAQQNGGFSASPSSPVPDLLSTATALFALKHVEYDISKKQSKHRQFIASLWNEDGGFSGHVFDDTSDCEYTFYAMMALGIL